MMKKILTLTLAMSFFSTLGLLSLGHGNAEAVVRESSLTELSQKKRCEKCKRGKDGKMVCEEVPCPK